MDEQNNTQPNESVQNSKNVWIIVVSIITTAFIVGGLVYWWQNQQLQEYKTEIESIKAELQSKNARETSLLEEIEQLKKQVQDDVSGDKYTNDNYNFNFTIPSGWVFQREEENIGGDPLRVHLTIPGFKEEVLPESDSILSISVTERTLDEQYQYMDWNISKESEEKITVAGREAVKRIGRHEFGGYLTVVILPNKNNTIELILRTNEEPYASEFATLLESFEFTK